MENHTYKACDTDKTKDYQKASWENGFGCLCTYRILWKFIHEGHITFVLFQIGEEIHNAHQVYKAYPYGVGQYQKLGTWFDHFGPSVFEVTVEIEKLNTE